MTLRLDPRYPLVWRSPDTIQLGVDHPVLRVRVPGPGLERVIDALRSGVPRTGAVMLGRTGGATPESVLDLLDELRPVLLDDRGSEPPAPPRHWVSVDGRGTTAARLRAFLDDLGLDAHDLDADLDLDLDLDARVTVSRHGDDGSGPGSGSGLGTGTGTGIRFGTAAGTEADAAGPATPDLAVIIGRFAIEPARYRRWLNRDVPHLPVVFGDREVRIGPLVEPGRGPCLFCLEQARVDADPAWPAMASQLTHRPAPTESPRRGLEVAVRVAGIVQDRVLSGRSELAGVSLSIDAASGRITRRAHRPHERCACRALSGTAIVPAGPVAGVRTRTSSVRVAGVPG